MLSTNQPLSAEPSTGFDVRQTVDQLNLIGLTIARDGTLTYANPYTYRVTAWTAEDIIGQNFFDQLIPKPEQIQVRRDMEEAMSRGGFLEHKEIELLARSGALRNVQINSLIVNQVDSQPASFTLIGEDITNKKRVASALSFSNAQLQDLVDNTSDLIQLLTLDGKFIFVNRAWREVLGYTSDQIAALSLRDVLHPDYADSTFAKLKRIQEGEKTPYVETVFRNKAGKTIFLSGSVNCRFDNGRPTAFRCILHDTTGKIRAEKAQKLYYSIANWTINTPNLDDLYTKIHQELGNIIDARNFFIALYDSGKNYLYFPYYVDEYFGGNLRFTKRRLGNGLTEYTVRANKPLFLYEKDIRQLAEQHV
ncbi:MAG: PAS domain S-box protein, partial [Bacteroidetes bacterium]|nr:PAS domain S-box protein [Fibrella sp.]